MYKVHINLQRGEDEHLFNEYETVLPFPPYIGLQLGNIDSEEGIIGKIVDVVYWVDEDFFVVQLDTQV